MGPRMVGFVVLQQAGSPHVVIMIFEAHTLIADKLLAILVLTVMTSRAIEMSQLERTFRGPGHKAAPLLLYAPLRVLIIDYKRVHDGERLVLVLIKRFLASEAITFNLAVLKFFIRSVLKLPQLSLNADTAEYVATFEADRFVLLRILIPADGAGNGLS